MKDLPVFDDFDMTHAEPILFGNKNADAGRFTDFILMQVTGDKDSEIDNDLKMVVNIIYPICFVGRKNGGCAQYGIFFPL